MSCRKLGGSLSSGIGSEVCMYVVHNDEIDGYHEYSPDDRLVKC